jgi:LysM repeat protein|nr:MAG TPA: LysM [Caudoviricetes sp.]
MSGLRVDGLPYWLVEKQKSESTNDEKPKTDGWLSHPRKRSDETAEILQYDFNTPSSIGVISFEVKLVSSTLTFYYTNRGGKRLPVLDKNGVVLQVQVGEGEGFIQVSKEVYPIVATSFEIHAVRRVENGENPDELVQLGLKNIEIKRRVYTRRDASSGIPDTKDSLGNFVTHVVKDWDANKAVDDNETTFWKSAPQPSPEAVTGLYVDCRDKEGKSQVIDRLWIDPVYSGQQLNLYYSTFQPTGSFRLDETAFSPKTLTGTRSESGLYDAGVTLDSRKLGITSKNQQFWVAGSFEKDSNSTDTVTLFSIPGLSFTSTPNREFRLNQGSSSSIVQTPGLKFDKPVFWSISKSTDGLVTIRVRNVGGASVQNTASISKEVEWGDVTQRAPQATLRYFIIKLGEELSDSSWESLSTDPESYWFPAPVIESKDGGVPETSLMNTVLAVDWAKEDTPRGGMDSSFFSSLVWTPIWADYVLHKGWYFFPQPRLMTFLKLEITNLTEEPYPIWEPGIETSYATFPIDVKKTAREIATAYKTTNTTIIDTTTTTNTKTYTDGSLSNDTTTIEKSQSSSSTSSRGRTRKRSNYDLEIEVGKRTISNTPVYFDKKYPISWTTEKASSVVYRGSHAQKSTSHRTSESERTYTTGGVKWVAQARYYTVVRGDYLIKIASRYGVNWQDIYRANQSLIDSDYRVNLLPRRYPGWWIFPGQQLRIPGEDLVQVDTTETHVERKKSNIGVSTVTTYNTDVTKETTTLTTRERFTTTSVHRYDIKTVKRDVELGYFAGIKELKVFRADWLSNADLDVYRVEDYSTGEFTLSGCKKGEGVVTATQAGATIVSEVFPSISRYTQVGLQVIDRPDRRHLLLDEGSLSMNFGRLSVKSTSPTLSAIPSGEGFFRAKVKVYSLEPGTEYKLSYGTSTVSFTSVASNAWEEFETTYLVKKPNTSLKLTSTSTLPFYTSSVEVFERTIKYELSNDEGTTYLDATNAILDPNSRLVFPQLGNKMKLKVTMMSDTDYVYSCELTPHYEVER